MVKSGNRRHRGLARHAAPALALAGAAGGLVLLLDHPTSAGLPTTSTATAAANAPGSSSSDVPTPTTTPTSCTGSAVQGTSVSTKYGPVEVQATVSSDGRLCDLTTLRAPSGGKSGAISSRAVPVLRQRALSAQSASFDGVSGATYTSTAYKKSLQSILDAN